MTFSEPVSPSEPLLKSLNLLKFNDIIHSEILSFVYQWFHKLVPSCFLGFFKPISSIHEYPTRQSLNENLFIKSIRTTQYGMRSLHYTGSNLWNLLPINIKQITPFSRFRKTCNLRKPLFHFFCSSFPPLLLIWKYALRHSQIYNIVISFV